MLSGLAGQNPGGVSVSGALGVILLTGLVVGTGLVVLLVLGVGRIRQRRATAALAADIDRGIVLLADSLARAPREAGEPACRARQDAADRLAAARALRAAAGTPPVLRAVRHTLLEGLAAAAEARRLGGADPGPVPPAPGRAPLVAEPVTVQVAGRAYTAYPGYRPGVAHHFPGGRLAGVQVPAGWYAEDFWARLL